MRVLDRFRHYLHPLRSIDENARFGAAQLERIASLLASERVDRLRREVRADPKRLAGYGYRGYSQNDEDGILQEIFRRIGITNRTFIEFGCGHGMENNTIYLLQSGWRGAWLDAGEQNIVSARNLHSGLLSTGKLSVAQAMITAENIDETLVRCAPESSIDLLSIDIDGNDYWIWKEIRSINARVVVIEYNATFRPPIDIVQKYSPAATWNLTNYFGASLTALARLGESKGFSLVGCNLSGLNAFFVRHDCLANHFAAPFTAENHYMPADYDTFRLDKRRSHPPGIGEYALFS